MDRLIETITEMVVREIAKIAPPEGGSVAAVSRQHLGAPVSGPKVLVVPGPETVSDELWVALAAGACRPNVLLWSGFSAEHVPVTAARWPVVKAIANWSKVLGDCRGVCLLGSDLGTLGSLASLGAGGLPPASVAIAAISVGLPVFIDHDGFERVRRHSARLAPGFVQRLEDCLRTVNSFGAELGGATQMQGFLARLAGDASTVGGPSVAPKSGGRDVVTAEDVEAVQRSGGKVLSVGMGAIVTPLARQQALEWGIEVNFQ